MEFKGTKGIWEGLEDEGVSFTDGKETGFVFQTGCGCCTSSELNIYDAKLIAAAPEMLDLLNKALKRLEVINQSNDDWLRGSIRELIKKATE